MAVADKVVVELELKDGQYLSRVRANGVAFDKAMDRTGDAAERAQKRVQASSAGIASALKGAAGTIAAGVGVTAITRLADSYTRYTNQLKVAGLEGQQLATTQDALFQIAQKYGVTLESLGGLYGRTSQGAKELGASQADLLKFSGGVAAALKIQGGTAESTSGAILQLSQALGGAIVRAEEFNSINEGARPILQAVADNIDRFGGSVSKLRAEVIDGKVTSQEFFQAFLKGASDLEARAGKSVLTISASLQTLNNALGKYIGETDQSLSATQRLSGGIKLLADNLETVIPAIVTISGIFGARYAAGLITASFATDGFITKGRQAVAAAIEDERAKTAAVAAGTRARTAAYTAESIALRAQVDTGRNAAGQFVSRAKSAEALAVANRNLAASILPATAATVRNTGAVTAAVGATRAFGSGLVALAGGPIGVAIIAVAALVAGINLLNERFSEGDVTERKLEEQSTRTSKAFDAYREAAEKAAKATDETKKSADSLVESKQALYMIEIRQAQALAETTRQMAYQRAEMAKLALQEVNNGSTSRTEGEVLGQLAFAAGSETESARAQKQADDADNAYKESLKNLFDLQQDIKNGFAVNIPDSSSKKGAKGTSAETLARREEAQRRRVEDVAAEEALAIAQARNDADAIRSLEREADIRTRQRDIIDASTDKLIAQTTVQEALTQATATQSRIDEARFEGQKKLIDAHNTERNITLAELDENNELLKINKRRQELQELINFYQEREYGLITATSTATSELAEIEKARDDAAAKRLADSSREDALEIARINAVTRADKQRIKDLEDQEEILRRIKEYTSLDGGRMSIENATARATTEVKNIRTATDDAEYRDQGAKIASSFVDILRSDDIGTAIGEKFKEAAFKGLENVLGNIFSQLLGGSGGGGGLGSIFSSILGFGGGRASGGPVRAGFSYDVGESGREKFVAPSNGYIIPNMGAQAKSVGTQSINIRQSFDLSGVSGDAAIYANVRQLIAQGQRQTLAVVKNTAPSAQLEQRLLRD